ncbi:MAG: hypothetical protein E4G99_12815 [Anaerolineales bacterium]|nr:MAG: hypothetical protein E4G99_12815 [Anaerolineales bacterium]
MDYPAFIWLIACPLFAAPVIYISGRSGLRMGRQSTSWLMACASFGLAWYFFFQTSLSFSPERMMIEWIGGIRLQFDGMSLLISALALTLGTGVTLFSGPYLSRDTGQDKYFALLSMMVGLILGLGCASDLFNLWIWFEAMAISSYLLVAFYRQLPNSLEAGVKYLVQSTMGSVIVLLGIGLVFAETGTLDIHQLAHISQLTPTLRSATALFIVGFGVKTALVPLHTWLPDAHSQAPSGISAMLSGVVIEAGLFAMLRVLAALLPMQPHPGLLLAVLATVNITAGNLLALRQSQIKRLLAYSSLAHMGYILLGIAIAFEFGELEGAQGGFFHMLNHGLMKGLAFLGAGSFMYVLVISAGDHQPLLIKDLAGAAKKYPLSSLLLSIGLLGLAGLPPLAGFMSKWQILLAGLTTNNTWILACMILAALNSVLALGYYTPIINILYRSEPSQLVLQGNRLPWVMNLPMITMALLILLIGLWPTCMSWLTEPAGRALLASFGG